MRQKLQILRKIKPPKPMPSKKLEEEDELSNDIHVVTLCCEKLPDSISTYTPDNEANNQSQNFKENKTVQDIETSSAHEVENFSFLSELESNAVFQNLTTRLFTTSDGYDFQRLQQLRSDTISEIVAYEPEFAVDDIVFEKVKYNKHVRYFRRTPSTMSLDDISDSAHNESALRTDLLAEPSKRTHSTSAAENMSYNNNNIYHQPPAVQSITQNIPVYVPMNVMNLEIKNPGKFESVVIAEKRDRFDKLMPVVKWDINGNSLDDDFYLDDSWNESADMNCINTCGNRSAHFKLDTESQKSSFRSSSTTLETWLDEDLLGTSLNERRHYASNLLCRSKV
ncbi:uncharacterized protein [Eurosta solidaginis]|uniref:uncharacterized protein isoform X2 n=1 Tax=Eurosta solidaginis TaxID=178769 RepID=UPI00353127E4